MPFEPTPDMLTDLKTLTGASDDQSDALNLILRIAGTKVLTEIRQESLPVMLNSIVVEIAADSYRLLQQAQGEGFAGEIAGTVSSVSDNGQSVSYRDSSYQAVLGAVATAQRNYVAQLDRFRKPGW